MTDKQIEIALGFYGIDDVRYRSALRACLEEITKNEILSNGFKTAGERLFTDVCSEQKELWGLSSAQNLFGCEMPDFSADLLILSGYKVHKKNFLRFGVDEEQQKIHIYRVRQQLAMGWPARPLNLTNILWASEFINLRITEIGRLQYEFDNSDGKSNVSTVNIHIPADGRLDDEAVEESLSSARIYIKNLYKTTPDFYKCKSWLLSNGITDLYKPGSNLDLFRKRFAVIKDGGPCTDDVLTYLFRCPAATPFNELPENTSLQRAVKKRLLTGCRILIGEGILK